MQINSYKVPQKAIPFNGLQENLAMGKKITREFRKEFGRLHSNSWLELLERRNENHNSSFAKFASLHRKYLEEGAMLRERGNGFFQKKFNSKEEFLEQLKFRMKLHHFGNCFEQAIVISNMLKDKNLKAKQLLLNFNFNGYFKSDAPNYQHHINILDYGSKFNASNPASWGEDAIIVDTWGASSGVINAKDAKDYFFDLFSLSKNSYRFLPEEREYKIVENKLRFVSDNRVYDIYGKKLERKI